MQTLTPGWGDDMQLTDGTKYLPYLTRILYLPSQICQAIR